MADQPQKRERASAPKVRTGCVTCKTRHVKCDERKPTCFKCENDGVACEGYRPVPPSRHPKKNLGPSRREVELPILSEWNVAQLALYPELASWSGQADLFHHFRTSTIGDFMMGMGTFEFWYTHVLPLAHSDNPVKYALCALGGVHLQFKTRREPLSVRSSRLKLDQVVIQLYNQAIHHMKSFMSTASQPNIKIVLVCCMVFTCIENLQGRYKEALRHLQAASTLIASITHSSPSAESDDSWTETIPFKPNFIDEISDLIYNLGQDASYFIGNEIVPNMTCKELDTLDMSYPRPPFTSCTEAEKGLREVKMIDNAVRHYFQQNFPRPKVHPHQPPTLPPRPDECGRNMWRNLMIVMQDWIDRFDAFKKQIIEAEMSNEERSQLKRLSLARSTWSLFMNRAHLQEDMSRKDAENILDIAEELFELNSSGCQPIFTPSSNLVAAVCLTWEWSSNVDIKWRCVGLLREVERKEGIWDSQEMADLYEGWMLARERGFVGDQPVQPPQLARLLSSLRISAAPSKAILSLSDD